MAVFFVIPFLPIFCVLLGLLGAFLNFLPDIMMYLFAGFGVVLWVLFVAELIFKNISKPFAILSAIPGLASISYCAYLFTRRGISIKGFFLVYLFMAVTCVIIYLLIISRSIPLSILGFVTTVITALLCLLWSIGYELSYTIKYDYHNIAYYETIDSGAILDSDAASVRSNTVKYREHTIERYEVGDRYAPAPKNAPVLYISHKTYDFIDKSCYEVLLSDGRTGFIFSGDVNTYFWKQSDFASNQRNKLLNIRWYGTLPDGITNFCENFFEKIPLFMKYNLVS